MNWCVERVMESFEKLMVHEDNVMVTVMDADSWVPEVYVDRLETHLSEHLEDRHKIIYQPPQIYTRNNM